jgi:TolB protein
VSAVRRTGAALLVAAVALAPVAGARAQAEKYIDVEKNPDARIAIGVGHYPSLPVERVGSPAGNVLAFDLEISGWFDAVRPGLLPPSTLNDWGRRGAEVLAEMELVEEEIRGSVRDVGSGDVLLRQRYAGGTLRERIHRFADDVVLTMTGEPGLARTRILCEWDPGEGKRIVLMDVDGYGMRQLTGEEELELSPRWSADGRSAVYTSYASGYPDVYVHDLRVGSREKVAHYEGLNAQGDLSPDGTRLVATLSYSGNPEICSKDLASGRIRRLTNHQATDASPCWSPDGRRVAFVSDRSGSPQIWMVRADGTGVERVTFRGSYNTAPDWAPDGTRIAYCALRPDGFQIQVVNLETGSVSTVTEGGGCEDPSWSPDGRSIVYSRKAGGRTDLYITNVSERKALRVTQGSGSFTAPDWSPFR